MSCRVADCVRWLSTASGAAYHVLLAIADFADNEGHAWPSIETIAKVTRFQQRSVKRALAELRARHADEIERTSIGHGRHHASHYQIKLIDRYAEAIAEKKRWSERHRNGSDGIEHKNEDRKGDCRSPLDDIKGDISAPLGGAKSDPTSLFDNQRVALRPPQGDHRSPDPPIFKSKIKREREHLTVLPARSPSTI